MKEKIDDTVEEQNKRKLRDHLTKIRKHGGAPPPEDPTERARGQRESLGEQQKFRQDWEAWKRIFGDRVIDLSARSKEDPASDYKLLGISPGAGKEEIRKAFYALAKKNHPDAGGDAKKFHQLMAAYENLTREA